MVDPIVEPVIEGANELAGDFAEEHGFERGRGYQFVAFGVIAIDIFLTHRGGGGFKGRKGWELKNHPLQPTRNSPSTIGNREFSGHALDQMQNRGIPPSVVENTIQHGKDVPAKPGTFGKYDADNNITVILDSESGRVVTVIPGGGD